MNKSCYSILSLCVIALAGCRYHTRNSVEVFPQHASIAIPVPANATLWRGVERELAEAVGKQVIQRTPYALRDAGKASTQLDLRVVSADQTVISTDPSVGIPREIEWRLEVDMIWRDQRTGRVLRENRGLVSTGRFFAVRNQPETWHSASRQATERMAQRIVDAMRKEWKDE